MLITSVTVPRLAPPLPAAAPAPATATDSVRLGESGWCVYGKAFGGFGAAATSLVARLTLLPGLAGTGAYMAGSMVSPWLGVLGAVLGISAGLKIELGDMEFNGICPLGRLVGGAVGGTVGYGLGAALGKLGIRLPISQTLRNETKGFSLPKLFSHLNDATYTSHSKLSERTYREVMDVMQPGDVVVTTQDRTLDTESKLYAIGGPGKGAWVHGAIYAGEGNFIEANGYLGGVALRPVKDSLAVSEHAVVLRPHYTDQAQRDATVKDALSRMGSPFKFNTSLSKEQYYCTAFVYHVLKDNAPQVHIKARRNMWMKFALGDDIAKSKDMDVVYNTGSSLWYNYMSKFT